MSLAYLPGTVTQGGADAFAIATVATALAGVTNVAYRVRELIYDFGRSPGVNASSLELSLTRRIKTAMPLITDPDVLSKFRINAEFATSGLSHYESVIRLTFTEDDELLVVEDPLYFMIDSTLTALTQSAYCRIGYERVSISALDRLSLLTQSLS